FEARDIDDESLFIGRRLLPQRSLAVRPSGFRGFVRHRFAVRFNQLIAESESDSPPSRQIIPRFKALRAIQEAWPGLPESISGAGVPEPWNTRVFRKLKRIEQASVGAHEAVTFTGGEERVADFCCGRFRGQRSDTEAVARTAGDVGFDHTRAQAGEHSPVLGAETIKFSHRFGFRAERGQLGDKATA